jgi:hypothetical protein
MRHYRAKAQPPYPGSTSAAGLSGVITIALLRKVRRCRTLKVDWMFTLACAAYNLVRMRNLMAAAVPAR